MEPLKLAVWFRFQMFLLFLFGAFLGCLAVSFWGCIDVGITGLWWAVMSKWDDHFPYQMTSRWAIRWAWSTPSRKQSPFWCQFAIHHRLPGACNNGVFHLFYVMLIRETWTSHTLQTQKPNHKRSPSIFRICDIWIYMNVPAFCFVGSIDSIDFKKHHYKD